MKTIKIRSSKFYCVNLVKIIIHYLVKNCMWTAEQKFSLWNRLSSLINQLSFCNIRGGYYSQSSFNADSINSPALSRFFSSDLGSKYMNLKNREVEFSQIFLLNFGLAFENKLAYHESSWNINFVWAVHFYYQHFKLLRIFVLIHFIPSLAVWPKTIRVQKFISWKLWIYLKFLTNRNFATITN